MDAPGSLIEAIKNAAQSYPGSTETAASIVGMKAEHFSFVRKLIGIKERHPALPLEDMTALEECFKIIEADRQVARARKAGRALITKYWKLEQPRVNGQPIGGGVGPRFKVTGSIVEAVKNAMLLHPNHIDEAAKLIGIGRDNYSFIKKLLVIDQDPTLPVKDRDELKACLDIIEIERRMVEARGIGEPLIKRHWRKRKEPSSVVNQRRRRFDQTILTIRESCATLDDISLPRDLTRENVTEAMSALTMSIERISRLMRKLVGGTEE